MRPELKTIERDEDGFVTDKCKADMYEALPIMVISDSDAWYNEIDYINKINWLDYIPDIELKREYTIYFKCPFVEQLEY